MSLSPQRTTMARRQPSAYWSPPISSYRMGGRGEDAIPRVMARLQSLFDARIFGPVTAAWLQTAITKRVAFLDRQEAKMKKKEHAVKKIKETAEDKRRKAYRKKHEYKGPKRAEEICTGPVLRCPDSWCNKDGLWHC
jgi:hypothetical protein